MPAEPTLIDRLHEQRSKLVDNWSTMIESRETERTAFDARAAAYAEKTDHTDADKAEFAAADTAFRAAEVAFKNDSDAAEAEIRELDERVRHQTDIANRRSAAAASNVDVVSEPLTYRRDNAEENSYFRDLAVVQLPEAAASIRSSSVEGARERLTRHAKEMDVEMPKRAAERARRARRDVEAAEGRALESDPFHRGRVVSPFESRATPSRLQGAGGYFVPPTWLVEDYIRVLRAGRVAAGLARQMDLPEGTDSINIPKLSTGTVTGIQGSDNAPVASQDIADSAVTATIKTIAGQSDVPLQLIEQSPNQILDTVLIEDLTADYNKRLDLQVIAGNGTNSSALNGGQFLGLYPSTNWSGTQGVTYTDGSPAGWKFLSVFGAMASKVASNRFDLAGFKYLMHPRRWFWFATSVDGNNRPLVESQRFSPFNVDALEESSASAEGLAGQMPFGPMAYIDANMTTADTAGGGTGQDITIGALWDDVWLFEGEARVRVLPEVLSGTLQLRYQIYNYAAMLVRYGESLAIASGSGFAAPTGAASSITF